jgi:hypothetical protein
MMKKTLVLMLISVFLLFSGCVDEKAVTGGVLLRGASPTEPPFSQIRLPENEDIVYITPTGEKYHTADCPTLSDTATPITLEQALLEEREACSRCH